MEAFFENIIEFARTSRTDAFIREEKEVCRELHKALSAVYSDDGDEVELVQRTIQTLNSNRGHHIRLESNFIHGNRSKVAFDYYGVEARKELGDLLVVSTMTNRGTPIVQKLTIVQAKRDTKKPYEWSIDQQQLFLLSNWPAFQGVTGIFPRKELSVPDYSGCLGSYYLYREPGDFVFISARELERSLGSRKRITFDELVRAEHSAPAEPFLIVDPDEELYYLRKHLLLRRLHPGSVWADRWRSNCLGNVHFGNNIGRTITEFSRLNVGELVFALESAMPVNDFAYSLLNTVVRYVARREQGGLSQLTGFNSDAPFFEDVNLEGARIGVVHIITEVAPG